MFLHVSDLGVCVQQVEDELSSPVVLFRFGQEASAGNPNTHSTHEKHIYVPLLFFFIGLSGRKACMFN